MLQIMGSQRVGPNLETEQQQQNVLCKCYQFLYMLRSKKDVLFNIGDWNAKVGSQETPGVTGKFGLGVQNEAGAG